MGPTALIGGGLWLLPVVLPLGGVDGWFGGHGLSVGRLFWVEHLCGACAFMGRGMRRAGAVLGRW